MVVTLKLLRLIEKKERKSKVVTSKADEKSFDKISGEN